MMALTAAVASVAAAVAAAVVAGATGIDFDKALFAHSAEGLAFTLQSAGGSHRRSFLLERF